jgi:ribosome-associated translation inhibitor RaiA
MIELGGNINLEGFEEVEPGKIIIVKKVVGNYVKNLTEKIDNFENMFVSFKFDKNNMIDIKLKCGENEIMSNSSDKNIFFALNNALTELEDKLKQ